MWKFHSRTENWEKPQPGSSPELTPNMSDAAVNGLAGALGGIIAQILTYPIQTVRPWFRYYACTRRHIICSLISPKARCFQVNTRQQNHRVLLQSHTPNAAGKSKRPSTLQIMFEVSWKQPSLVLGRVECARITSCPCIKFNIPFAMPRSSL